MSGMVRLLLVTFISMVSLLAANASEYDIVIKNGLVIDGTRTAGKIRTVAIQDGKIIYIGDKQDVTGKTIIDATGLIISPGFVDVHNHADFAVKQKASLGNESFIRQGVTTLVVGPDGYLSPTGIRELKKYIVDTGSSTNIATYIGHNAIRGEVMGMAPTLASNQQLADMKKLVREGMELGAVGLSTGLMYTPGMYSDTAEVIELAKVAGSFGGSYDSHVRNPVHDLIKSYQEVIEIGRQAKLPVKIGHAKLVGLPNKGLFPQVKKLINAARDQGITLVSDQYPYDGAANVWLWEMVALPEDMQPKQEKDYSRKWVAALLIDPVKRAYLKKFNEVDTEGFSWVKAVGYTSMRVVVSEEQKDLIGKHISELATELNKSEFDVIADMVTNPKLNINITLGSVEEDNVRKLLVQPWNMVSSDGAYSDTGGLAISHPRSTGSYPRVLGRYVRDEGLLDFSEAIYKIATFPSNFIGLGNRGYIKEGYIADITIFDPKTIIDRSDWVHPERLSEGVSYVIIDGKFALKEGKMTSTMVGRFIPHNDKAVTK